MKRTLVRIITFLLIFATLAFLLTQLLDLLFDYRALSILVSVIGFIVILVTASIASSNIVDRLF
ncbi:hypothetical protein FLK61_41255 [Paenalkalicoccus suaedae]|uniref:Uncharacterized protein n=1 Tax=Paenalkalicoccus suaedae TaxID=2592382 RepID=A0A859FJN9_9BACI|nr:hypothetical protein [Paenalkalicoccus suaedae]QKS73021.1 hypothetical protein FLK61_41255 [Paenalkalicoccus suaedae]